jgi:hypothetical protein
MLASSHSHRTTIPSRSTIRGLERIALVVLLGLFALCLVSSFVLGPVLLLPLIILGYMALGVGQLLDAEETRLEKEAQQMTEVADTADRGKLLPWPETARTAMPVTMWGKVSQVVGRCPTGRTPQPGQLFTVEDGKIWPELCVHAERAILDQAARMGRDGKFMDGSAHFADADHELDFELHQSADEWQAAA